MNELYRPLVVANPYPLTGSAGTTKATRFLGRQHAHRPMGQRIVKALSVGVDESRIRINGCRPESMSSKVFEYLRAKYPVFAISPEGSTPRRLFAETRGGVCALPHGPTAESLAVLVMVTRSGSASLADRSALARHELARLKTELAVILDRLTAGFPHRRTST